MSGIGIFSPPLMITRTDERSRWSMSGNAMMALTMAGASHTVGKRVVVHEGARLGVLEDVANLGCRQPPVDRHGDGPEVVGGEDRLQELGAVVGQKPDHVAPTDTPFRQPAGQRRGARRHLRV